MRAPLLLLFPFVPNRPNGKGGALFTAFRFHPRESAQLGHRTGTRTSVCEEDPTGKAWRESGTVITVETQRQQQQSQQALGLVNHQEGGKEAEGNCQLCSERGIDRSRRFRSTGMQRTADTDLEFEYIVALEGVSLTRT